MRSLKQHLNHCAKHFPAANISEGIKYCLRKEYHEFKISAILKSVWIYFLIPTTHHQEIMVFRLSAKILKNYLFHEPFHKIPVFNDPMSYWPLTEEKPTCVQALLHDSKNSLTSVQKRLCVPREWRSPRASHVDPDKETIGALKQWLIYSTACTLFYPFLSTSNHFINERQTEKYSTYTPQ